MPASPPPPLCFRSRGIARRTARPCRCRLPNTARSPRARSRACPRTRARWPGSSRGRSPVADGARRISCSNTERICHRRESDRCFRAGCRTSAACPARSPVARRFEAAPAAPRGSPPLAGAVRRRTTVANTGACRPSALSLHPAPATRRVNASASVRKAAAGRDRRWRPPPNTSRPPRAAPRHRPTGTPARR